MFSHPLTSASNERATLEAELPKWAAVFPQPAPPAPPPAPALLYMLFNTANYRLNRPSSLFNATMEVFIWSAELENSPSD